MIVTWNSLIEGIKVIRAIKWERPLDYKEPEIVCHQQSKKRDIAILRDRGP